GTSGSQRYGVTMWSGDIAANMISHSEHMNAQLHMALSGVDYFGSDIGGFYRQAADPILDTDEMYSLWMANAVLLDVPLRPHTANTQNRYQTAPSLIGDVVSNLANVRLRYEISPYLYTLAHNAYRTGEAVFPPLVYHFQDDPIVRPLGSQKMIGSQMMMATLTDYDPEITTVYLPQGGWFNYHTGAYIQSAGETVDIAPSDETLIQAPLLVRDGAIIPVMNVDENTLNMLGQRVDGNTDNTLIVNIYHATTDGTFTLIEDDGETMAYRDDAVRETTISHYTQGNGITIEISEAIGTFDGAGDERMIELRLNLPTITVGTIRLNGENLPQLTSNDDGAGWMVLESGVVLVRSEILPVSTALTITVDPAQETTMPTDRPLFLTHYMPWYQTPSISGRWGWHWTMNHFNPSTVDENNRPEIA
ncbi:MAG TPA: glycoside hydrolase family 31 protein, partial [Aggregatilineales bacterium]|nr:glycoside hydrolase family 31 protein [Aggregatilineales bacterium]